MTNPWYEEVNENEVQTFFFFTAERCEARLKVPLNESCNRENWSLNYPHPTFTPFTVRDPYLLEKGFPTTSRIWIAQRLHHQHPVIQDVLRNKPMKMTLDLYLFVLCSPMLRHLLQRVKAKWFDRIVRRFEGNCGCLSCGGTLRSEDRRCLGCDWIDWRENSNAADRPVEVPCRGILEFIEPRSDLPVEERKLLHQFEQGGALDALISMLLFLPPKAYWILAVNKEYENTCCHCLLGYYAPIFRLQLCSFCGALKHDNASQKRSDETRIYNLAELKCLGG